MRKKFLITFILIFIIAELLSTICFGFSDDLFEFDLPSDFGNVSHNGIYAFVSSKDSNKSMLIFTANDTKIKKSVWDIDDSDFNQLVNKLASSSNIVNTDKRAKLGKEKAVKVTVRDSSSGYMDIYILASNKYLYMVSFRGKTLADLNNSDYTMIKNSFKLKDHTTNYKLIYILVIVVLLAIRLFLIFRKKRKLM